MNRLNTLRELARQRRTTRQTELALRRLRSLPSNILDGEALTRIITSIHDRAAVILVTGTAGVGKTYLLQRVVEVLGRKFFPVVLSTPPRCLEEFITFTFNRLQVRRPRNYLGILGRIFVRNSQTGKQSTLFALERRLTEIARTYRRAIILLDDAQNIPEVILEQVLRLVGTQYKGKTLAQLVLAGLPEVQNQLEHHSFYNALPKPLACIKLAPLNDEQTRDFISENCTQGRVFSAEAINRIALHSGGIPRLILHLSEVAEMMADLEQQGVITADSVDKAARARGLVLPVDISDVLAHRELEPKRSLAIPFRPSRTSARQVPIVARPTYPIENLNKLLENLQTVSTDIEASAVISQDGTLIAGALPEFLDDTRRAGVSLKLLDLFARTTLGFHPGNLEEVVVGGKQGFAIMINVERGAVLMALANEHAKLGLVLLAVRETADSVKHMLWR